MNAVEPFWAMDFRLRVGYAASLIGWETIRLKDAVPQGRFADGKRREHKRPDAADGRPDTKTRVAIAWVLERAGRILEAAKCCTSSHGPPPADTLALLGGQYVRTIDRCIALLQDFDLWPAGWPVPAEAAKERIA